MLWDDLPPAGHSGADAQDAARDVLSRAEFHRPGPSIIERIERWVQEGIQRVLEAIGDVAGGGMLAWLILLAALALVVVMLLRFGRGVQRDAPRPAAARVRSARGHTADEWRDQAAAHEAAGRWRDALRCRYRALVAELAGHGLLDDTPGKTTGEERADIARSVPAAAPSFAEATTLFDDVWYGDAETGPADGARLQQLSDAVLEKAGR